MIKSKSVRESMLLAHRNSQQNMEYYAELEKFFAEDPSTLLMKLRSFALYTPRQVVSDFLARYELFSKIVDVPGSVVECGVFNGQGLLSFGLFSSILEPNNLNRLVYGIDTFEGFPEISVADRRGASDRMKKGGYAAKGSWDRINEAVSLFDKNRFIGHVPKVKLVRGDVTRILDQFLRDNPHLLISLLYLDLDLYRPTKAVLRKLMPRVVKGGIVAFDELNVRDYPGETTAMLESFGTEHVALKRIPFCSRISYFVK
jgi:hypothetical protein